MPLYALGVAVSFALGALTALLVRVQLARALARRYVVRSAIVRALRATGPTHVYVLYLAVGRRLTRAAHLREVRRELTALVRDGRVRAIDRGPMSVLYTMKEDN